MDRLDEIIELLQDCVDDWADPDAQADVQKMKAAIQLLRAGAEMRKLHRQFSEKFVGFHPKCAEAWDAALGGEDESGAF